MCRFAASTLVRNGLANAATVSVAYAIGQAEPVMVEARNERGAQIDRTALKQFDFRPLAIIERLGLRQPVFQKTAAYGHFGRPGFSWERRG
jgi:S-adenosylmethionine synthetase